MAVALGPILRPGFPTSGPRAGFGRGRASVANCHRPGRPPNYGEQQSTLGDGAGRMRPASVGERTERGSRLKGRRWVRQSLRRRSFCRRVEGVQDRAACGDQGHGKQDGQVPQDGSAAR